MATERKVDKSDLCQTCQRFRATYLVDIHAATQAFLARQCTRCMKQTLRRFPASSAVNLHKEYQ